ncbi:hypothetical protein D3C76_1705240 [compost metagenome]
MTAIFTGLMGRHSSDMAASFFGCCGRAPVKRGQAGERQSAHSHRPVGKTKTSGKTYLPDSHEFHYLQNLIMRVVIKGEIDHPNKRSGGFGKRSPRLRG